MGLTAAGLYHVLHSQISRQDPVTHLSVLHIKIVYFPPRRKLLTLKLLSSKNTLIHPPPDLPVDGKLSFLLLLRYAV